MNWILIAAILIALFMHWVADFPCQTDKMALNKSKHNGYLMLHCFVYSFVATIGVIVATLNTKPGYWLMFFGTLYCSHMLIDFFTSRLASYFYRNERRAAFFNTIGFDQFLHVYIIIILVFLAKYKAAT